MTVPRKDDTLAVRVKKLEDAVRRIRLVPSLAQSAVAPLAVKGSGWYDSSAGNEPRVFDGAEWVPVRDETIAVAQTTADTAQSTAVGAAADAAVAVADAAAAVAATSALQTDLDAAEAAVAAAQADVDTLTGTTIPGLTADIAAAQAEVDGILPITETKIADDAITTPKIAANAVTAAEIAANTITAAEIAANAVTASELAANAVTAGKIAAGTIVAADIAAGQITTAKLAADAIDGMVITGAIIQTSVSGTRVVLGSDVLPEWKDQILMYTGHADSPDPAEFQVSGHTDYAQLSIFGPPVDGAPHVPGLNIFTNSPDNGVAINGYRFLVEDPRGGTVVMEGGGITADAVTIDGDSAAIDGPYYYAYLAASATINNNTSTAISWTDEATSPSSGITRSGSVFTVPRAGRYKVTFQAYWAPIASPAGTRLAQIYTGNSIGTGNVLASAPEQPSATAASACLLVKTIRLAASAQFRTEVSHTQGATMTNGLQGASTGNLTYVQVEWVGP